MGVFDDWDKEFGIAAQPDPVDQFSDWDKEFGFEAPPAPIVEAQPTPPLAPEPEPLPTFGAQVPSDIVAPEPTPPEPETHPIGTPVKAALASTVRVPVSVFNWIKDDLKKAKKSHETKTDRVIPATFLDAYSSFQQRNPKEAFEKKKAFLEKEKIPEEERQKTIQNLDNAIKTTAKIVDDLEDQVPDWVRQEVAKAQEGELNPLKKPTEALTTWATLIADQAGLWGANIAGPGAGAGIAIASMREEFKNNAKQHGLTEEEIDAYVEDAAFQAGMLEYAGEVATLGLSDKIPGLNKLTKPLKNFLGKKVLGRLAGVGASAITEGLTEYSQQAVFNHYLGKIAKDKGMTEDEIKETFKNDPILKSRDFWVGAGIGGIMGGGRGVLDAVTGTQPTEVEKSIVEEAPPEVAISPEEEALRAEVQAQPEAVEPKPTIPEVANIENLAQQEEVTPEAEELLPPLEKDEVTRVEPEAEKPVVTPEEQKEIETGIREKAPKVEKEPEVLKVERRKDTVKRKKIEEMTEAEAKEALAKDEMTGLGSKRAWDDVEKKPVQGFVDVDGLKWVNDNLGYESGNVLLKSVADALTGSGVEAYRIGGDEIKFQGDDKKTIDKAVENAYNTLQGKTIVVELPNGEQVTWKGMGFSHGISESPDFGTAQKESEQLLKQAKLQREQEGLRAARGEEPPGISREVAEGVKDRKRELTKTPEEIYTEFVDIPRRVDRAKKLDEYFGGLTDDRIEELDAGAKFKNRQEKKWYELATEYQADLEHAIAQEDIHEARKIIETIEKKRPKVSKAKRKDVPPAKVKKAEVRPPEVKPVKKAPPKPEAPKKAIDVKEPLQFKKSITEVEKQVPKKLWDTLEINVRKTPEGTQGQIYREDNKLKIDLDPEMPAKRVVPVIFHEVMGHAGASNVLRTNKKVYFRLKKMYDSPSSSMAKTSIQNAYKAELERVKKRGGDPEEVLFSEWIAHNVEKHLANPEKRGTAYRVYRAVRQFLIDLGLKEDTVEDAMESVVREIRRTNKFEAKVDTGKAIETRFAKEIEPFYSPTEKTISELKQEKGVVPQIKSMIKKGQFKKAEIEWMGLEDYLDQNPKATKTDVLDFVRSNQVEVEERAKDVGKSLAENIEQTRERLFSDGVISETEYERLAGGQILEIAAEKGYSTDHTKYSKYTLPGGENYRELLFKMPVKKPVVEKITKLPKEYVYTQDGDKWAVIPAEQAHGRPFAGLHTTKQEALNSALEKLNFEKEDKQVESIRKDQYRSTHWEEPNVFAHARVNDRVTPEGEKILFIEEIQSDWAREKREDIVRVEDAKRRGDLQRQEEQIGEWEVVSGEEDVAPKVPDFPHRKNWQEYVLKNLLNKAVQEGYDRVAWVSGEQTADRYDLSKQVDQLLYHKNPDGTYAVSAIVGGTGTMLGESISVKELPNFIGKDVANKIVQGEGSKTEVQGKYGQMTSLSGENLKIGGEWAKSLYDKQIPQFLKKYTKKWGGEVESVRLGGDFAWNVVAKDGSVIAQYDDKKTAQKEANKYAGATIKSAKVEEGSALGVQQSLKITPEMKESIATRGQPLFAKELKGQEDRQISSEGIPKETVWDKTVQKVQDKFHRLKKLQTALTPDISEDMDTYLAQELFHGRTEAKLDEFERTLFKPLRTELAKSKADQTELEDYLYAKHAPERNAYIEKINPEFAEKGIPGSGMSNEEAQAIIDKAKKEGKYEDLEKLSKMVNDINSRSRQQLKDAGLITEDMKKAWEAYKNYVPLRGIAEQEEATRQRTGKGFDIRGKESKRALGRKSKARNILAHTVLQMNEAIIRAEKNKVGQTFLEYVQANPNPDLWEVDKVEYKPQFDENKGEVVQRKDPKTKLADNVMSVKKDGQEYYITINDPALARGMVNLGAEKSNKVLEILGTMNRYLSMVNTSLVPEFVISNLSRDLQTAMINMGGEKDAKAAFKVAKSIPKAMKGVWQGEKGKDTEWSKWYKEFKSAGGKIGFFGLEDVNKIQKDIAREISLMKPGKKAQTIKAYRAVKDLVMNANEAVENSTRLATYVEMRKRGMSKAKAASVAKNITVNFNRKGELGTLFNSLYVFSNAGVQGTARLFQALKNPRVQKIAGGIVVGSLALAQMNRFLAGEDEDDENYYDKIPNWVKENNLIIMKPGTKGEYFKIPVPYGYNVFHATGQAIDKAVHNQNKKSVMESAAMVAGSAANAFNPLGSSSTLLQTMTPTAGRWLTDLSLNKNFFGAPIMKEDKFGIPKSKAHTYFKSTSEQSKAVAQALNDLTGGTKYQPGMIDISPDLMDYVTEYLTGGAGRTLNQSVSLIGKLGTDKEIPVRSVPFVRRFMGEVSEYQDVQNFYDNSENLDKIRADYNHLKRTDRRKALAFRMKNKEALKYTHKKQVGGKGRETTALNRFEKSLRDLRKLKDKAEKAGKDDVAKKYEQEIVRRVKQFNKQYNQRVGK